MNATATLKPNARKLTWRAGKDGIAHASEGRDPRTLCNEPTVLERSAWPIKERHETCLLRAEGCSWAEIAAMHGDR